MPYSDYRPDLMGSATLEPCGAFEAGSYQSFTLVYTAGAFGVDDTGSVKIGFRFATDFGPVQFDDPKGQGYTTVEASNGATLECKWEFKRNIRPWSRSLYIGVAKHFLAPGDTITIRFGDRRFGSPGIRLQTYCESEFEFHVLADPIATYDYVPLPQSPKIAVVPGSPVHWHAVLPTLVRAGEPFRLAIKADDKWGNPSNRIAAKLRLESSVQVRGLPETVQCETGKFAALVDGLIVDEETDLAISVFDDHGSELCRSNPLRVAPKELPLVHFWGDTHGQSNETLGTNSAREYFEFGRDKAFLDVMGHQGNDFQITGAFWAELNPAVARVRPAGLLCLHTRLRMVGQYGRRRRSQSATLSARGRDYSPLLTRADRRCGRYRRRGRRCAHCARPLPAATGQRLRRGLPCRRPLCRHPLCPRSEARAPAVEVHSAWGTFEWILRDAFEKNYCHRVGVVANSDGHKGRPGACYPGASFFGSQGGLTCFLAERLDRGAIFEAMRRRHHYGTTGNRMILHVSAELADDAALFARDPAFDPYNCGHDAATDHGRHRARGLRHSQAFRRSRRFRTDREDRHFRRLRPHRDRPALRRGRSRHPLAPQLSRCGVSRPRPHDDLGRHPHGERQQHREDLCHQ